MSYIALYRKYRPQNFCQFKGQHIIIQTLKNAIKYNKIHHCYLFSGNRGVGKTSLAKIWSKNINCLNWKLQDCCNECDSCLRINQKNNLDIIEIDGASYNGVDEIRELKDTVQYKSHFLKYKIYIIDEIHVLSINAFNALLKIIEEPPVNVIFILITSELNKIPKTIFSRAQHFHLTDIEKKNIYATLKLITEEENILINDKALEMISFYAKGSLRDALNILDQISSYKNDFINVNDIEETLGIVSHCQIKKIAENLLHKKTTELIIFLDKILQPHIEIMIFLNDVIDFFLELFIEFYRSENEKNTNNFFNNLSFWKKNEFFKILFELKNNLQKTLHKKNLLIYYFIQIKQLIKDIKCDKDQQELSQITEKENSFIQNLKKILISADEKTKKKFLKVWEKLNNYPNKELSKYARLLHKAQLLFVSLDKEMLLSCEKIEDYNNLLITKNKNIIINKIFNAKKKFIEDYMVILNKDWEQILRPIYLEFIKKPNYNKNLNLSSFKTDFYQKNSILQIEKQEKLQIKNKDKINNKPTIIEMAEEFFDTNKIIIEK
ncbi:MAG: DNA polymerase III subunit gamma/tau [Vigna little leaf phytoplasma]|nr:DNA polymerase III subunit gamma/tau [Vigna little leaf phytoplasma]